MLITLTLLLITLTLPRFPDHPQKWRLAGQFRPLRRPARGGERINFLHMSRVTMRAGGVPRRAFAPRDAVLLRGRG